MNGGMLLLNNNFSLPVKHSCVYYGIGNFITGTATLFPISFIQRARVGGKR